MNYVNTFLDNLNIDEKSTLVVAVSYGPDSMFLLNLLREKYENNKIICAHVHHNHRKQSDKEAILLKDYCKKNKIVFEFMKIDKYENDTFTEEEARKKRYLFFDKVMHKYKSKYLFTAHHGDDLSETILMRIVRGSNLKGYAGITLKSERNGYQIIRPLLYITKDKIKRLCKENNIPYATDKSNNSTKYTRNRYRNKMLKFLKKENENVHEKFLSFSKELQECDEVIEELVLNNYEKIVKDNKIDLVSLKKQKDFIIKKIIEKYLLNEYKDDIKIINNKHTNLILDMIKSDKSNVIIFLPRNKTLFKTYNKIYFDKVNKYNSYCYVFDGYLSLPNGYAIKKVSKLDEKSNYICALDSNEIKLPLYVRNKKDGDRISILGLNGSKKIKDVFIDEKVDIKKRSNYPVLVDKENNILWVPGLKKSKYDKSKRGKYDIILKYFKEEK